MFHIKYPRFRGFYSWEELGCLARALGFPKDLFKDHVTDEIEHEDNGLPIKELQRMLDYKMLYKALHLSLNNHSADWNCCVIKQALSILDKQGLTFEDLYNARLAYQAYEASDMKGMVIDKHTILRTLKMCGKTISPMKLMHRVKHSKGSFEEEGRMQLYEFLDLILWANEYEPYIPQKTYGHFEMENEMFKLIDFESLLSHHDQKLANALDKQYLEEEWTFSKEKHGEKGRFKEPPVACSESRVERARDQKKKYLGLKNEVVSSQKTVYYSQQGYVRPRPLTAPNLSMYKQIDAEEKRKQSIAAHHALYNKYQKLLKKAYKSKAAKVGVDLSDKPVLEEYKRCETPRVVSDMEIKETKEEFENIMFNKETGRARYEIKMDTEMDYYIPTYKEKWIEKKENAINPSELVKRKAWEENLYKFRSSWQKEPVEKVKDSKVSRYDDDDIINHLAYPVNRLPPSHAKKCDARFRGWYDTRSKKGAHHILVSPYFHNSPKGRLLHKLAKMSDDEIKNLHGEFLFRYTKKEEVVERPVTAPPVLAKDKEHSFKSPSSGYHSMDDKSARTTPKANTQLGTIYQQRKASPDKTEDDEMKTVKHVRRNTTDHILEEIEVKLNLLGRKNEVYSEKVRNPETENDKKQNVKHVEKEETEDDNVNFVKQKEPDELRKPDSLSVSRESNTSSQESAETTVSESIRKLTEDKPKTKVRSKSAFVKRHDNLQNQDDNLYVTADCRHPRSKSAMDRGKLMDSIADIPIPYMDHSKPKVVSVGSIGKISLLESISESKYWEDVLLEELARRQEEQNGNLYSSSSDSAYSDLDSYENFEYSKEPRSKKRTKSKSDIDSESAILGMMLEVESGRRKKARSHSSKWSNSPRSPLPKSLKSNRNTSSSSSSKSMKSVSEKKTSGSSTIDAKVPDYAKAETDTSLNGNIVNVTDAASTNKETLTEFDKENDIKTDEKENTGTSNITCKRILTNDNNNNNNNNTNKPIFRSKQSQENVSGKLETENRPHKQKKVLIISTGSIKKDTTHKTPVKKYERLVNRMDGTISKTLAKRLLSST